MSKEIARIRGRAVASRRTVSPSRRQLRQLAQTAEALSAAGDSAMLRVAEVQSEGYVAGQKVHEAGHVARDIIADYSKTKQWVALHAPNPLDTDDLRLVTSNLLFGYENILQDLFDTLRVL
jgi:hypothetical protein